MSLSLSLGLSSLASQKRHVDSLFLDEGFRTLDIVSLEFALNVLKQLQNSGKMVGDFPSGSTKRENSIAYKGVESKGDGMSSLKLN